MAEVILVDYIHLLTFTDYIQLYYTQKGLYEK